MDSLKLVSNCSFLPNIYVYALRHLVLAFGFSELPIVFGNHAVLLFSGKFSLICSLPVIELSALNTLCLEFVAK